MKERRNEARTLTLGAGSGRPDWHVSKQKKTSPANRSKPNSKGCTDATMFDDLSDFLFPLVLPTNQSLPARLSSQSQSTPVHAP